MLNLKFEGFFFFYTLQDEQKEILKNAEEIDKKAKQKVKDLEYKMKNAKEIREKELKQAETALDKAKKKKEESGKQMKEKQQVCCRGGDSLEFSYLAFKKICL